MFTQTEIRATLSTTHAEASVQGTYSDRTIGGKVRPNIERVVTGSSTDNAKIEDSTCMDSRNVKDAGHHSLIPAKKVKMTFVAER